MGVRGVALHGCCEFSLARLDCTRLVHSPAEQWLGCQCRLELVTFCKARCSGVEYGNAVPYVAMRVMMATFGVALVPLGWYTAVELGMSTWATHLVALMVLCGRCRSLS